MDPIRRLSDEDIGPIPEPTPVTVEVTQELDLETYDQLLWGVSYTDAFGKRIDPRDVHQGSDS